MVRRIVGAGRVVLADRGYPGFTTNKVAQQADISPGSLYQYFTDKESILDQVLAEYWDQVTERMASALSARATQPVEPGDAGRSLVRDITEAVTTALSSDPALLRVLVEEIPQTENTARRRSFERHIRDLVALFLVTNPTPTRADPAIAAWVLVTAFENLAVRWVLDSPGIDRDAFLDEVSALIGGYLGL